MCGNKGPSQLAHTLSKAHRCVGVTGDTSFITASGRPPSPAASMAENAPSGYAGCATVDSSQRRGLFVLRSEAESLAQPSPLRGCGWSGRYQVPLRAPRLQARPRVGVETRRKLWLWLRQQERSHAVPNAADQPALELHARHPQPLRGGSAFAVRRLRIPLSAAAPWWMTDASIFMKCRSRNDSRWPALS